ncbi:hypothetical protein EJ02DRAFT_475098, partial [Clathrospora elynae]
ALVAMSSALPSSTTPANSLFPFYRLACFDNKQGITGLSATPLNIYQNIKWNGMSLSETGGIQQIAMLESNSPPNRAAFAALNVVTIEQGTPAMTVNYADSTMDHFDLLSFYYGCTLSTEAPV